MSIFLKKIDIFTIYPKKSKILNYEFRYRKFTVR